MWIYDVFLYIRTDAAIVVLLLLYLVNLSIICDVKAGGDFNNDNRHKNTKNVRRHQATVKAGYPITIDIIIELAF